MFVIPKMTNGGAERVVANLANYWCKNNEVRIVAIASKKTFYALNKKIELRGQELKINRKNKFTTIGCYAKFFTKSAKFIERNIENFRPDCVISFLIETDILTYVVTRKNSDIVKVFSERNDPTKRGIFKRWILKKVYKNADLFVCQSKKIFNYYNYIPYDRKVIIPNPLDDANLPDPVVEQNHDIVAVGRLCKQKNFKLLIDSFILAANKIPEDCNLIIYGDGPMKKELQNRIDVSGMGKRIKLAGKSGNILDRIKGCAAYVMSSDYEGFPNSLLEAIAVGLPVISTNFYTGVAKDLVGRKNGLIVHVSNKTEMSNAIIYIMTNEDFRNNCRYNNIHIREEFSIDKIGHDWSLAIKKIKERK